MKKYIFTALIMGVSMPAWAYQRYFRRLSFELWGIPSAEKVFGSLLIAVLLLVIGFNLLTKTESFGWLGFFMMLGGLVFMLPLMTWLEFAAASIITISTLLGGAAVLVLGVYLLFRRY